MQPIIIICGLIGTILGWSFGGGLGLVTGLALGYVIGELHLSRRRLRDLERKIRDLESRDSAVKEETPVPQAETTAAQVDPETEAVEGVPDLSELLSDTPTYDASADPLPSAAPVDVSDATDHTTEDAPEDAKSRPNLWQRYFTGGNLVVRAGVVVLFFGIAFLVKYAAERNLVPIEFRLAGIAMAGMAMIGIGWKLRLKRFGYALALQGGGIGVLYLTVFGTAKIYGLIPPLFAFALMVALVALSAVLAILQDARSLALLGATGGFLAPVLISSGTGSHVMLFSYYLILNGGILGVAWFKSWRELNLTGFVFTFGIGAFWGLQYYRPEYFRTTEPFLIAHFLIYFLVAILFALRQPLNLRGYVDGTLVFALPLAVFGLQSGLVRGMEYALAASAVAMAAVYTVGATLLWRRAREAIRPLAESFLALGVMFATVAVPLATDGYWTAATWSLEGAALVWIGVRQNRALSRAVGVLLQAGAGAAALYAFDAQNRAVLLSGAAVSLAGLFSSYCLERSNKQPKPWEHRVHFVILGWGLAWWFGTGVHEIQRLADFPQEPQFIGIFSAASLGFMGWLALRINWASLRYPVMGLMPLMVALAAFQFLVQWDGRPSQNFGWLLWPLAVATSYGLLRLYEGKWNAGLVKCWHLLGLWLWTFLLTWEMSWVVGLVVPESETWSLVVWGLTPALVTLALLVFQKRLPWPVKPFYYKEGVGALAGYLLVWCVVVCGSAGDPAPLPYVPVLNPMDLMLVFIILLVGYWFSLHRGQFRIGKARIPDAAVTVVAAGVAFLALNAGLARTVHFWGGVPYRIHALTQSILFQSTLSVVWSLLAMGIMGVAARKQRREAWFVGAGLLAVVVVKLFAVDLSGTGTVARIISFLAVGALMLVIGYFSPLPPQNREEPVS